jgi:hypothetical protein
MPKVITLFHRTTAQAAKKIRAEGFRDGVGDYMTSKLWRGVWLSDRPLDCNSGAKGGVLLCVLLTASERWLHRWEWIEVGKPYREWLIPARTVNRLGTVFRVTEEYTSERLRVAIGKALGHRQQ